MMILSLNHNLNLNLIPRYLGNTYIYMHTEHSKFTIFLTWEVEKTWRFMSFLASYKSDISCATIINNKVISAKLNDPGLQ